MQSRTNLFDQSEYEKIESLHTESFEIEHELKTLTMRMSDFLTKQVQLVAFLVLLISLPER